MRALSLFVLFACNGSPGNSSGETGDSEDTEPQNVLPTEGSWQMSAFEYTTNECHVPEEDTGQTGGTGTVEITGDDSFTIEAEIPEQGSITFACTVNVQAFSCEDQTVYSEEVSAGTTLTVVGSESGQVVSPSEMNGVLTLVASCEGPDCEFLETVGELTFPCDTVLTFSTTLAE